MRSMVRQTITVTVNGDNVVETDELFLVDISIDSGDGDKDVSIGTGSESGTITNDDTATLSISDYSFSEGNTGTVATFDVTLSNDVQDGFDVDWRVDDDTATTAGYSLDNATLTFAGTAGEIETITVLVNGDTTDEPDETFDVILENVSRLPPTCRTSPSLTTPVSVRSSTTTAGRLCG